jgi:hypothetical protein
MPTQNDSDGDNLPPQEKARLIATKTLQRLRELNKLYPSTELTDAIRSLEVWHEKNLGSGFEHRPLQ